MNLNTLSKEQTLKLNKLDTLEDYDFFEWTEEFRGAQEQCDWPAYLVTTIAKSLLGSQMRIKFGKIKQKKKINKVRSRSVCIQKS